MQCRIVSELARRIHAGRGSGKGKGRARIRGGGLLGPVADDWIISEPVIPKMQKRPNFLVVLQFQDGLWEEIFLCCVSTAWLQLLLGAAQLVLSGRAVGLWGMSTAILWGVAFPSRGVGTRLGSNCAVRRVEKPREGTASRCQSQQLAAFPATLLFTSLYFSHILYFTTLYFWAAARLPFVGLRELLSSLMPGLESHRSVSQPLTELWVWSAGMLTGFSVDRWGVWFFFLSARTEYSKSVSCCQEDCIWDCIWD